MKICEYLGMCTSNPLHSISQNVVLTLEIAIIILFLLFVGHVIYVKHWKTLKNILLCTIAIILFELMIDPAVVNTGFSSWTYYFHDLTIILTMGWVLLVSASIYVVDHVFAHLSEFKRFWLYLSLIDAFTLVSEIFLVTFGLRHYGPSILSNSLGYFIPFTQVPVGVVLVIPAVFALVLGFTKYWEKVLHLDE